MKKISFIFSIIATLTIISCTQEELTPGDDSISSSSKHLITAEVLSNEAKMAVELPYEYTSQINYLPKAEISCYGSTEEGYVTGALAVNIKGVDPRAAKLVFISDKQVAGTILIGTDTKEVVDYGESTANSIVMNLDSQEVANGEISAMIPLPADTYNEFSIQIEDEEGLVLYAAISPENSSLEILPGEVYGMQLGSGLLFDLSTKSDDDNTYDVITKPWSSGSRYKYYLGDRNLREDSSGRDNFHKEDIRYSIGQPLGANCIMQSFHVKKNGTIYYVQNDEPIKEANNVSYKRMLRIVKRAPELYAHDQKDKNAYNVMKASWFCHGQNICVDETPQGDYIWLGCHGMAQYSTRNECNNNQTLARFRWQDNTGTPVTLTRNDMFDADGSWTNLWMYKCNDDEKKHPSFTNIAVSTWDDKTGSYICLQYLRTENKDTDEEQKLRVFRIYDKDAFMAAPVEQAMVYSATSSNLQDDYSHRSESRVWAHNIARINCLVCLQFDQNKLPRPEKIYQGFDYMHYYSSTTNQWQHRVYAIYGNSEETKKTEAMIVTIGDDGDQMPECSRILAFDNPEYYLEKLKGNKDGNRKFNSYKFDNGWKYYEVEGIRLSRQLEKDHIDNIGLKLYVGFATKDSKEGVRRANIIKFARY